MRFISDFFNSLDATTYFLVNSGVVIGATAVIFSIFGILFGAFTWGRYKEHWLSGKTHIEVLKAENALLKRRIAEQFTRPLLANQTTRTQYVPIILPPTVNTGPTPATDPVPVLMPRNAAFCIWTDANWTPQPAMMSTPPSSAFTVWTEPASQPFFDNAARSFTIWTESHSQNPIIGKTSINQTPLDTRTGSGLNDHSFAYESDGRAHPFCGELESGKARHDPLLGIIFVEPPKKVDDLTKIKGINSSCRQSLQAQGIYTYKQIAHWTPVQIGEFALRLSLDARIQVDRWIDQARELHMKKHGDKNSKL